MAHVVDDSVSEDFLSEDMKKIAGGAKEFKIPTHVLLEINATRRYVKDLQQQYDFLPKLAGAFARDSSDTCKTT